MRATLHPYRLAHRFPITLRGVRHQERQGLLLRLEDGGCVAWGDCAPLPGFSREALSDAADQLRAMLPWLADLRPSTEWADPGAPIHAEMALRDCYPSVRFAIDLAALDLVAARTGKPLPHLLHPDPQVSISLNALLTEGSTDELVLEAQRLVTKGYQTLKLKVGDRDVELDVERVRALRRHIGPSIDIRCDANQAWSFSQAVDFAEGVAGLNIEYVEEPLREPSSLGALWFDTQLPLAVDESLADLEPSDLEGKGYVSAVVLKPTILGGMLRTLAFARQARALGMKPVISGAFESGVAMRGHVALAAATGGEPAGLDPYNRLVEDVLRPRLHLDRPLVDVRAVFAQEHDVGV
jgi:o-succinylbenzoate synthase